jgi:L-threonylcarbamoyladenylate synthase
VKEKSSSPAGVMVEPSMGGIEAAASALRAGGLVAFPTDTFFALGASALNPDAVERLFEAKGRAEANPVPVLIASAADVSSVAEEFTGAARALAEKFWPGPLTLVLPARAEVPRQVTAGTGTIGVRVPAHEIARKLIAAAGVPLTGTSANISGQPPCKTSAEVLGQLGGRLNHILDAPCGSHSAPSTVVDFASGKMRLIREGAITYDSLQKAIETA